MTIPNYSPEVVAEKNQLKARHHAITKRMMASIYEAQDELEKLLADSEIDLPEELPEDPEKLDLGIATWIIDSWCLTQRAINQAVNGEVCDTADEYQAFREETLPEIQKRRKFNAIDKK